MNNQVLHIYSRALVSASDGSLKVQQESGVKKALEELVFHTETLDILGVYESSTFRQK